MFAEAATGGDGVMQKSYKELKDAGDVRVFAVADGNVASNAIGLHGVGVAEGLADKGYIYTDRPAYRAGQIVHVRGCLRHAVNDAYTVEKGKKYTLESSTAATGCSRSRTVKLGPFGTFHAYVLLPPTSPQGAYRVSVRDDAGQNYQGTFQVHEYQLGAGPAGDRHAAERLLSRRGDRGRDPRGRTTTGRRWPAAKSATNWPTTASTRPRPTRRARSISSCPLASSAKPRCCTLDVALPERNVHAAANYMLATQAFSIRVEHGPAGLRGRRDVRGHGQHERRRRQAARAETDAQSPRTDHRQRHGRRAARRRVSDRRLPPTARRARRSRSTQGGRYVVRVEGTDRFENAVSGQYAVQISDDKDRVRLRILADKHTYKVGDTAAIKVHWRQQPALGAGHVPGRPRARLPTRRAEARSQPASDSDERAAGPQFRSFRRRHDQRRARAGHFSAQ